MKRFSEMEYNRPDMEALKAVIAEATENVKNAKSAEEVRAAYFSVQEKEEQADTMYTIAHVRNTIDTSDEFYDGEMAWLREAYAQLIPVYNTWEKALTGSAFRGELEAEFGQQLFRRLDADLMTSDERIVPETVRSFHQT